MAEGVSQDLPRSLSSCIYIVSDNVTKVRAWPDFFFPNPRDCSPRGSETVVPGGTALEELSRADRTPALAHSAAQREEEQTAAIMYRQASLQRWLFISRLPSSLLSPDTSQ